MNETFTENAGRSSLATLKALGTCLGSLIFAILSVTIAWYARRYQLSEKPMPNGKGGYMTYLDGYYIALICFLISIVWFIAARKLWAQKKSKPRSPINARTNLRTGLHMTPHQKFLNFLGKVVGVWFIIGGFGIAAWAFLQGFSQAGGFDAITSIMVASGLIPCILGVLLIKAKGFGANDDNA